MRHVVVLSLVVAAGAVAFACGDDEDDKKSGSGPNQCEPDVGEDTGDCTEAEVKEYSECVQGACKDQYEECNGPGYLSGNFGGPCKSYMECTSQCECNDTACFQACQPSSECTSCLFNTVSCASTCLDKLSCATSDLGDGGLNFGDGGLDFGDSGVMFGDGSISFGDASIDISMTCDDLLDCCNSISDADAKTNCTTFHGTLSSSGGAADFACSAAISTFCP